MPALRDLTPTEIATLCGILAKLRPHGAPRWQEAGIRAALVKVQGLDAANALMAAIRLSQDRDAATPAQIGLPASQCWAEKPGEWRAPTEPYDVGKVCGICDQPERRCKATEHISGHTYIPKPVALAAVPSEPEAYAGDLRDRRSKARHIDVEEATDVHV